MQFILVHDYKVPERDYIHHFIIGEVKTFHICGYLSKQRLVPCYVATIASTLFIEVAKRKKSSADTRETHVCTTSLNSSKVPSREDGSMPSMHATPFILFSDILSKENNASASDPLISSFDKNDITWAILRIVGGFISYIVPLTETNLPFPRMASVIIWYLSIK